MATARQLVLSGARCTVSTRIVTAFVSTYSKATERGTDPSPAPLYIWQFIGLSYSLSRPHHQDFLFFCHWRRESKLAARPERETTNDYHSHTPHTRKIAERPRSRERKRRRSIVAEEGAG
jgi:hypothetical protein